MPSLLDQNRPVPSLFGADFLSAEWVRICEVPSLQSAEFAGAEFARCRSVQYPPVDTSEVLYFLWLVASAIYLISIM